MNIKECINEIINGMSLREAEIKYGVDRKTLKEQCIKYFKTNPEREEEFKQTLYNNKKNSTEVKINLQVLQIVCRDLFNRNKTLREMAKELNVDEFTLKEKLQQFVLENKELLREYIEYQATIHPDYSYINFHTLIMDMLKKEVSQSQIAAEYGIPSRTISREIEKLKNDEKYSKLYEIAKHYSMVKMQRRPLTSLERVLIEAVLKDFEAEPLFIENAIDKEEAKYIKAKEIIKKAEQIKGTEKQKAEELGIGISTLRRYKIFVKQYEEKKSILEEDR